MSLAPDPVVSIAVRAGLALLFLSAALHKLRDLPSFRAALAGYRLLPSTGGDGAPPSTGRWVDVVSVLLAGVELAVGAALLVSRGGALPAALLLLVYTAAIGVNLRRGRRDIDCGCAGPAGRMPIGGALVGRNLVLIALALLATRPLLTRPLLWVDAMSVAACVVFAALLYAAIETAMANDATWRRRDRRDVQQGDHDVAFAGHLAGALPPSGRREA